MAISLNGTTGITTPGITNTGAETVVDLTTTGNTILGDASGDTLTVTGGTTTFTQGTANGVAFLNGSKVLTTGSANLTFNGTTLTANTIGAFTLGGTIAGGGNQINNVVIGTTTPLAGSFTTLGASSTATLNTLVSSGATLTGGTINGMTVGATTASTGAFTTLSATTQPVVRPQDVVKAEVERVVNSAAVKTPRAKKILAVKASAGSKSKKI